MQSKKLEQTPSHGLEQPESAKTAEKTKTRSIVRSLCDLCARCALCVGAFNSLRDPILIAEVAPLGLGAADEHVRRDAAPEDVGAQCGGRDATGEGVSVVMACGGLCVGEEILGAMHDAFVAGALRTAVCMRGERKADPPLLALGSTGKVDCESPLHRQVGT